MTWVPPTDIDAECAELCSAMNLVPGIRTVESCCGHGHSPYAIWFVAESLEVLPDLLYWFDACHCGQYGWRVIATTDCGRSPVTFGVEGPVSAYDEASDIARLIREDCCS